MLYDFNGANLSENRFVTLNKTFRNKRLGKMLSLPWTQWKGLPSSTENWWMS